MIYPKIFEIFYLLFFYLGQSIYEFFERTLPIYIDRKIYSGLSKDGYLKLYSIFYCFYNVNPKSTVKVYSFFKVFSP